MASLGGPNIITNGLVLSLDAANVKSYVSGSTTWRDLSGNNNSGSLVNGPTFNSANGGSIVFDGVDDYVNTNYTTPIGTGGFTYSTWIKFAISQLSGLIIKRIGDPTYEQLSITIAGDSGGNTPGTRIVVNDVKSLSLNRLLISDGSYNDDRFHNLVATRTSTTTNLYIDGVLLKTSTSAEIDLSVASKLFIGRSGNDQTVGGIPFNGSMSNVSMYNRTLSASEVFQNYEGQKSRFGL
jgi:hypothetical protein